MRNDRRLYWQLPLTVVLVLGVFALIAWIGSGSVKNTPKEDALSYVSSVEGRNPREVLEKINEAKTESESSEETVPEPTVSESEPQSTESIPSETEELSTAPSGEGYDGLVAEIESLDILSLSDEERAALKSAFKNTVVIGDSMAQALLEYGLLDGNHVFYKRGASIRDLSTVINKAMAMLPKNVIFFTGLNDTDFIPDTNEFAQVYRDQINYVLSIDPSVHVYVCSMTPPSNALGAARPDLARSPLFDAELKKLPQTVNVKYIDLNWMVKQQLYMSDQIHMNAAFYSVWIRYVAMKLGIS